VPCVPLIHGRRRGFHDSANLNLAKRRLCDVLVGTSLGSAAHCCAISVARVRAARTASIPRSNRPLPRRTDFGAAKSCFLVIFFMIRPPDGPIRRIELRPPISALSWLTLVTFETDGAAETKQAREKPGWKNTKKIWEMRGVRTRRGLR
jgi:hypothetical protein